jgi:hypothetical protein
VPTRDPRLAALDAIREALAEHGELTPEIERINREAVATVEAESAEERARKLREARERWIRETRQGSAAQPNS